MSSEDILSPKRRSRTVWRDISNRTASRTVLKSYKYKHKHKLKMTTKRRKESKHQNQNCDRIATIKLNKSTLQVGQKKSKLVVPRHNKQRQEQTSTKSRFSCLSTIVVGNPLLQLMMVIINLLAVAQTSLAFCPAKCNCNELSANCTQISSISIVPMTLNPLLKRLVLNNLPISELSNSLSIYHQLEYLNLNANQLTRIRYQNFNFKPAPHVLSLAPQQNPEQLQQHVTPELSQVQARHLKQSIERSNLLETNDGEIRHHLRELHLADNKLDQLGDFNAYSEAHQQQHQADLEYSSSSSSRLRAHELEKLAPFLTLSKLELLDLSGNQLVRLNQHSFLGLVRLKSLDLSRNQLEFIDKHALVGLLALESLKLNANKLAQHQHQLNQFNQIICRGPLVELQQLDLSQNAIQDTTNLPVALQPESPPPLALMMNQHRHSQPTRLAKQAYHLVLPNEIAICAPKLRQLSLRGLKLKYVQVNAFDNLNQLERLDLSENLLEQVPLDALLYSRSNLTSNLKELNLSNTQIEFIAASSFKPLKQLERLDMSRMPQLISFDLASLVTYEKPFTNNIMNSERFVNLNLVKFHASNNKRLQSFHSSLNAKINFERLELVDLAGSSELRELQLDKMIDLRPGDFGLTQSQNNKHLLQVDISNSNSLNCSSCQLNWLVRAVKQQTTTTTMMQLKPTSLPSTNQLGDASYQQHNSLTNSAVPSTSQLGWSPIPFDPYNSLAGVVPTAPRQPLNAPAHFQLINVEAINCAWPFSMPLIELINLETNYAPLFNHECNKDSSTSPGQPSITNSAIPVMTTSSSSLLSPNNLANLSAQNFHQQSPNQRHTIDSTSVIGGQNAALNTPLWAGTILVLGLVLIGIGKLVQLLVYNRRSFGFKFSPSFTATTSLDDSSPTTSCSAGSSSSVLNPLCFATGVGQSQNQTSATTTTKRHHNNNNNNMQPTLVTSTLPDGGCVSTTLNNWPVSSVFQQHCYEPQKYKLVGAAAAAAAPGGAVFAPGDCNGFNHQRLAGHYWAPPSAFLDDVRNNERLELDKRHKKFTQTSSTGASRMRDLRAKFQKSLLSSSSKKRQQEKFDRDGGQQAIRWKQVATCERGASFNQAAGQLDHGRDHRNRHHANNNNNNNETLLVEPNRKLACLPGQVGAFVGNQETNHYSDNNNNNNNNHYNCNYADDDDETTRPAGEPPTKARPKLDQWAPANLNSTGQPVLVRPMFHLNGATTAAVAAADYQLHSGDPGKPTTTTGGGVQIKEPGVWPVAGGSKLKQSNLFLRFVDRLSGRRAGAARPPSSPLTVAERWYCRPGAGNSAACPNMSRNAAALNLANNSNQETYANQLNHYDIAVSTTTLANRRNLAMNYGHLNGGANNNGPSSPPASDHSALHERQLAAIYGNHLAEMELLNHYSVCGNEEDEVEDRNHDHQRRSNLADDEFGHEARTAQRDTRRNHSTSIVAGHQRQSEAILTSQLGASLSRRAHDNESFRAMTESHHHHHHRHHLRQSAKKNRHRQQIEMGNDGNTVPIEPTEPAQGDAPQTQSLDYDVTGRSSALNECDGRSSPNERLQTQFQQTSLDDSIYAHG